MTKAPIGLLPPLDIRGLGTPLVEGLHFYVLRMARALACAPADLCREVMALTGNERKKPHGIVNAHGDKGFEAFVLKLEELTGVSTVRHTSVWAIREVVDDVSLQCASSQRRWCPACYEDWDEDSSYELLACNFKLLSLCPIHGVRIVEHCAHCGRAQPLMVPLHRRRNCVGCGSSLGWTEANRVASRDDRWVDSQVLKLVKLCASPGLGPIPAEVVPALSNYMRELPADAVPRGYQAVRFNLSLSDGGRLSLRTLVNFAAFQSQDLSRILLSPAEVCSPPMFLNERRHRDVPRPSIRRVAQIDRTACVLAALTAKRGRKLVSLAVVMDTAAVTASSVRARYQEVVDRFVEEHDRRWGQVGYRWGRGHCCKSTVRILLDQLARGQPLSIRSIVYRLSAKLRMPASVVRMCVFSAARFVKQVAVTDSAFAAILPSMSKARLLRPWPGIEVRTTMDSLLQPEARFSTKD